MSETPYTETEFLLAVMENDRDKIHRLWADMLPGERRTLHAHFLRAAEELET